MPPKIRRIVGAGDDVAGQPADEAQRRAPRAPKKKPGKKLTLHLPPELDFRLDNLASFKAMTKAGFALRLLDLGCGSYSADKNLRAVFLEISGQTSESALDRAG